MEEFDPIQLLAQADHEEQLLNFVPKNFDEYLGQEALKNKLKIYTQAALMRQEALDHLLLFGPPGLGKTTLSRIIAHILQVEITICSGPMLERTGDLVALLTNLAPKAILFIDEIHRMSADVEEVLYSALEEFRIDVIIGQGAAAKSINLPLPPFTLIGATTKSGMISAPLRSRFGIIERLDFYTDAELAAIVLQNASFLQLPLSEASALLIAQASRGTPRIAKKIVRRVRDFAQVSHNNNATEQVVLQALQFLGIDQDGLSTQDRLLLQKLLEHDGRPVALDTLAALLAEDSQTIEEVYEPFLMRKGFIEKTARGRQIPGNMLPFLRKKFFGQTTLLDS